MRRLPYFAAWFLAGIVGTVGSAAAEEFEQHGAHEHGHVTLDVALDGGTLALEWSAPALHVIGFEHAPRNEAERAQVAAAAAWITRASDAIGLPPAARCRVQQIDHTPPALRGATQKSAPHDHDELHADYRARYTYTCAAPAALAWFEPWLLRKLRGVEHVEVNVVAPGVQRQLDVDRADARIALR